MLRLHDQMVELNGAAKKYKNRSDAALAKVQTAEARAEELREENERLKKELADWRERSDRRLENVKAEHQKALEEARKEAHDAGFTEAGEAYAEDIYKLVRDGMKKGFGKGYLYCCDALGIAGEDPKYRVPEMPDFPVAEDDGDDDEVEEVLSPSDIPLPDKSVEKTPAEETSSEAIPPEKSADETANLAS